MRNIFTEAFLSKQTRSVERNPLCLSQKLVRNHQKLS